MEKLMIDNIGSVSIGFEGFGTGLYNRNRFENLKVWIGLFFGSIIGIVLSQALQQKVPAVFYPLIMTITGLGLLFAILQILICKYCVIVMATNKEHFYIKNKQIYWNTKTVNGDMCELPLYKNGFRITKKCTIDDKTIYMVQGKPIKDFQSFAAERGKKSLGKIYNINRVCIKFIADTEIPILEDYVNKKRPK